MLRHATSGDIPALMELQNTPGMLDGFNPVSADSYAKMIAHAERALLVWDIGGAICGMAMLALETRHHFFAELRKFGTFPTGQGHGSAFAQSVLDEMFNKFGMFRVETEVYSGNARAIAFYRRLGFVEEGCLRQAVRSHAGERVDLIRMACLFSERNLAEHGQRP